MHQLSFNPLFLFYLLCFFLCSLWLGIFCFSSVLKGKKSLLNYSSVQKETELFILESTYSLCTKFTIFQPHWAFSALFSLVPIVLILRYSGTIKFILLKCTIQWFLVYAQGFATITRALSSLKKEPVPIQQSFPIPSTSGLANY